MIDALLMILYSLIWLKSDAKNDIYGFGNNLSDDYKPWFPRVSEVFNCLRSIGQSIPREWIVRDSSWEILNM